MSFNYTHIDPAKSSENGENATDLVAVSADYIPDLLHRVHCRHDNRLWHEAAEYFWPGRRSGERRYLEIRIPGAMYASDGRTIVPCDPAYHTTLAGFFESPFAAAPRLARLAGVSPYILPNPVDLASRVDRADMAEYRNTFRAIRKGASAGDAHIPERHWLFVDIDPEKAPGHADDSASDAERLAPRAVMEAILAAHPEIAAASIFGTSGNGYWLLVRIVPLPADHGSRSLAAESVGLLASRFDQPGAHIDQKTFNASRIVSLPGCIKCKGLNQPDRPWRMARMLSAPRRVLEPLDLAAWFDREWTSDGEVRFPKLQPRAVAAAEAAFPYTPFDPELLTGRDRLTQARIAGILDKIGHAVSGQGGHNRTFNVASLLVWDFALEIPDALSIMRIWNFGCSPCWNEQELIHKCEDARNATHDKPRGFLLVEGEEYAAQRDAERLAEWEAWDRPDESAEFRVEFDDDEANANVGEGVAS